MKRSLLRGDRSELGEIGAQSSARDLAVAMRSGDRTIALAGLAAAPHTDDAWALLVPIAERAASADRPLAAQAAKSAEAIARAFNPDRAANLEVPVDELRHALQRWQAIAAAPDRWSDVRVSALDVCVSLASVIGGGAASSPGYDVAAMTSDPEPEVRRAAFELFPEVLTDDARALAGAAVASERNPVVAVAAAQALCAGVGLDRPAGPALDALGSDGLTRLRALMSDASLPPAALLDGARCLAADASEESKRAVRALQTSGPRSIRRLVRRLR